jgi:hypothetical protein
VRASGPNAPARSGYFGVSLIGKIARAVGRVERIELGSEQLNLITERHARLGSKRGQQLGFRCPEAVIEAGEEFVALLGGDDSAGAPVGRIRAALDQPGGFEVIEEVGHDRTVDAEVLGEGELTPHVALSRGGENLVAPWTAGKIRHRGVRSLDVGPKNHAETPAEVICQRVLATRGVTNFVLLASDCAHQPIIRAGPRNVVDQILCSPDDLYLI